MGTKNPIAPAAPAKPGFKQRATKEFKDFFLIALYLAFFFCALVAYTNLLLKRYDIEAEAMTYGFAIFNALVIGKVILIGEMVHISRGAENRPLYQSVLIKSVVFSVLVFAFHFIEEFVKRLIHHEPAGTVWREMDPERLIARSIIVFSTFIPLFAFMEIRRVMGEEEFYALFRKRRATDDPGLSTGD